MFGVVRTSKRWPVLAGAAAAVVALTVGLSTPASARSAADPLPRDPAANGYLGFCDEAGHNVTGGSITSRPFVWKTVASKSPPAAFQGTGESAILNIYQPRPDTLPAEWSGDSLTAAAFYNKPKLPTVQATYADLSLADFMQLYPAKINGLFQLRMYFGKANYGLYSAKYPATTIQVQGRRWHVVSGGTVNCGAAKAISNEQLTGVVTKKQTTPRKPDTADETIIGGSKTSTGPINPGAVAAGHTSTGAGSTSGSGPAATGADAHRPASSHNSSGRLTWLWIVLAAGVAGVAVVAGIGALRRRRPRSAQP